MAIATDDRSVLDAAASALDDLAELDLDALTPDELSDAVLVMHRLRGTVEATEARLPASEHIFRLGASPTFARGLSSNDLVHVVPVEDRWYADAVVESGGHSTIRVVLFDDAAHDQVLAIGDHNGCVVDHTEINGLLAIDVPPEAGYAALIADLSQGQSAGRWDVDQGNVADSHASAT